MKVVKLLPKFIWKFNSIVMMLRGESFQRLLDTEEIGLMALTHESVPNKSNG